MSRPKSEAPRTHRFTVRVTDAEWAKLTLAAGTLELGEYVRSKLFESKPKAEPRVTAVPPRFDPAAEPPRFATTVTPAPITDACRRFGCGHPRDKHTRLGCYGTCACSEKRYLAPETPALFPGKQTGRMSRAHH